MQIGNKGVFMSAALKKANATGQELQLLGIADFAARLGISVWTARSWAYAGKIASVKVGAGLKVPLSELMRVVAEGTRPRVERPCRMTVKSSVRDRDVTSVPTGARDRA